MQKYLILFFVLFLTNIIFAVDDTTLLGKTALDSASLIDIYYIGNMEDTTDHYITHDKMQKSITKVDTTLSGILKSTNGTLSIIGDSSSLWNELYGYGNYHTTNISDFPNDSGYVNTYNGNYQTASFLGDVSGTYNSIIVIDDLHGHSSTSIANLVVADFASPNISNWTNDTFYVDTAFVNRYIVSTAFVYSKSFSFESTVASDDRNIWYIPYNITIISCHLSTMGAGSNVSGQLEQWNDSVFVSVIDSTDLSATTNTVAHDSSIQFPLCTTGYNLHWRTQAVVGTPSENLITYEYRITP